MKLTRYRYTGPFSSATLRVGDGAKAEQLDVQLHDGASVGLPADHEYTQVLIALKHLTPELDDAAPPADADEPQTQDRATRKPKGEQA